MFLANGGIQLFGEFSDQLSPPDLHHTIKPRGEHTSPVLSYGQDTMNDTVIFLFILHFNHNGNAALSRYSMRINVKVAANPHSVMAEGSLARKPHGTKPLGEALGIPPSSFMPSEPPPSVHTLMNGGGGGGGMGDDLHEVEL
ncbi:hypothetical protein SDJN02_09572, partial [Cucurbita argyrosperma subsp. argyrosperma]